MFQDSSNMLGLPQFIENRTSSSIFLLNTIPAQAYTVPVIVVIYFLKPGTYKVHLPIPVQLPVVDTLKHFFC